MTKKVIWGEEGLLSEKACQLQCIIPKTHPVKKSEPRGKKKLLKIPRRKKLDYQQKLASRNQDHFYQPCGQDIPMAMNMITKKRSNGLLCASRIQHCF